MPVAAGLGAHQPHRRLRLAAEPQTGRREVSAPTDARKTLAYDFFRILRAPLIGVSGAPDEVRTFAEMVRMTAEMLVAQRNDQQHRIWLQKRIEDVLTAILLSGQSAQRAIVE
ncbi:sugar diacid recognition domain-containing protein [Pseudomonas aeruginosa]|uniref:sugar diacid recognition domain-containing protein n=1 Tax=Pseudomonas aeruginosa TaxID=287 RepID=UPI003B2898BF